MAVIVYRKNPAGEIERLRIPAERLQAHLSAGYVVNRDDLLAPPPPTPALTDSQPDPDDPGNPEPDLMAQLEAMTLEDLSALENPEIRRYAEAAGIDNAQNAKIKTLRDKLNALVED